jgi:hypothetical protein
MGIMKQRAMDSQERRRDALIAKLLNIPLSELDETEWEIEQDENSDGLVTDIRVEFSLIPKPTADMLELSDNNKSYSIGTFGLDEAERNYRHFATTLGIDYPAILYSNTTEIEESERGGVPGITLQFGKDTLYEVMNKVKENQLSEDYKTWVPLPPL